jgi:hypothetical protein
MPRKAELYKDKDILSLNESALYIGVDKKLLSSELKNGHIPGRQVGKCWHIYKYDLIDWVRKGNQAS